MKTITLKEDGTFQHIWIKDIHASIPDNAIQVSDEVALELLNNHQTRTYDHKTKVISDVIPTAEEIAGVARGEASREAVVLRCRALDELLDWAETDASTPASLKATIAAFKAKKEQA